jgi:hypothetical protein
MNESPRTDNDTRQQLRQQWLQQAAAAFDRYFDGQQTPPLVTFTQREGRACALSQERAAWLLEQGAEGILQVRAAYLSEDGRAESYWKRPRAHRRAAGRGRLRRPAATSQ